MRRESVFVVSIATLFFAVAIQAAVPQNIHFSGALDTASGAFTGTISIKTTLYESLTAASGFWSDTQSVEVTNGRFHLEMGPVATGDLDVTALHVGIQVRRIPRWRALRSPQCRTPYRRRLRRMRPVWAVWRFPSLLWWATRIPWQTWRIRGVVPGRC